MITSMSNGYAQAPCNLDGVVDDGEACDDGNDFNCDACTNECQPGPALDFVFMSSGNFDMGHQSHRSARPVHSVHVDPFWMSRKEITNQEYSFCVNAGACTVPKQRNGCTYHLPNSELLPVNCISWRQANSFTNWCGADLSLPTEAQWEYAAKDEGRQQEYPMDEIPSCLNVNARGCGGMTFTGCSHGVHVMSNGMWTQTESGLCDIAGNVREWVYDTYTSYHRFHHEQGQAYHVAGRRGRTKVVRGGSYLSRNSQLQTAYRGRFRSNRYAADLGFRVACWDGACPITHPKKLIASAQISSFNGHQASGQAYIFDAAGQNEISLNSSNLASGDVYGSSMAVGNNKIVVGAQNRGEYGYLAGSVYIYDHDGSNEIKLISSDITAQDAFGYSVAVGNNKIAVGAVGDYPNDPGNAVLGQGAVYVYDLDGSNEIKIIASDGEFSDRFGSSVAIGYNKIIVGSPNDDDHGDASGSVYIYNLDGTGEVKLYPNNPTQRDHFGYHVFTGSNKIFVSTTSADNDHGSYGAVYVYDIDGSNEVKITSPDNPSGFGHDVAFNHNRILIGAPYAHRAYLYDFDGNHIRTLTPPHGNNDQFGFAVAIDREKIYVSAPFDDETETNSGAVYIYDLEGTYEARFKTSNPGENDRFASTLIITP